MSITGTFSEVTAFLPNQSREALPASQQPVGNEPTADTLSVDVADTLQDVVSLRRYWEPWARSTETDPDYYLHKLTTDPAILHPCVITVCEKGIPQAMLVGHVAKRRLSATVSFINFWSPEVRVLEIVNRGRMGRESDAIDQLLIARLLRVARCAKVDLLLCHRQLLQSGLFRELQQSRGLFTKPRVPHAFAYSVLPLTAPGGKRAAAFSGKNRRETRRKTRILQRYFPQEVKFRQFSHPDELDLGMRDATAVSNTTWQRYLDQDTLGDEQTQNDLRFCAGQGWLRVFVMYVKGFPCAFLVGQLYKGTFYCQNAGYNPAFARFSPGSLLTAWALEHLAADGVEVVDLGQGGQEHNRRLGCRMQEEGVVHVYFPTLRGLRLNMFFGAVQRVKAAGRKTITELRLTRASKAWSQFLISRWRARTRTVYLSI
jgi:Acetyltransferase (GNAT) domain